MVRVNLITCNKTTEKSHNFRNTLVYKEYFKSETILGPKKLFSYI